MVSASWVLRQYSNRSACEPRAPRWTSEINKVRKRRSGLSSLIASLPMREQLADSRDSAMTQPIAGGEPGRKCRRGRRFGDPELAPAIAIMPNREPGGIYVRNRKRWKL